MSAVPLFTNSLLNTPQLILPGTFDSILRTLDERDLEASSKNHSPFAISKSDTFLSTSDVPVLCINGPLICKSTAISSLCGIVSYRDLVDEMTALAASGAKRVVMLIDSPGGESYGCFEAANDIRRIADKHGIRLIGYCDGICASASYGLAAVCDELISNPESQCGSIGVVTRLRNNNKQLQQNGIEDTYIYSGSAKVPFKPNGKFKQEFLDSVQSRVEDVYGRFVSHVAQHRNLKEEVVRGTQADMFNAELSCLLKLADSQMTREEFKAYIQSGKRPQSASATRTNATTKLEASNYNERWSSAVRVLGPGNQLQALMSRSHLLSDEHFQSELSVLKGACS